MQGMFTSFHKLIVATEFRVSKESLRTSRLPVFKIKPFTRKGFASTRTSKGTWSVFPPTQQNQELLRQVSKTALEPFLSEMESRRLPSLFLLVKWRYCHRSQKRKNTHIVTGSKIRFFTENQLKRLQWNLRVQELFPKNLIRVFVNTLYVRSTDD